MAQKGVDQQLDDFVDRSDGNEVAPSQEDDGFQPQYRMVGDTAVPVAKKHGALWKSRKKAAISKIKTDKEDERWDAALRYYRNDHSDRTRQSDDDVSRGGVRLSTTGMETENIVFANATSIIPMVYAKDPNIECSAEDDQYDDFANCVKHLVNTLFGKKNNLGVNLKPVARRAVLMSILTNVAYVEVGYTLREQSSEQTLMELQKLGTELSKATDKKTIQELEAKLTALEDKVDLLRPSGPWLKFRGPRDVLVDPDCASPDMSDAKWVMIKDYVETDFLKVVYGQKNEEGDYTSVFKPSHVLKLQGNGDGSVDDEVSTFSLIAPDQENKHQDYGFEDESSFKKAQRTCVWYVWDKATRRCFLYNDSDWTWPLWVWDDPYQLDCFFPLTPLNLYVDPENFYARSETLMYLDQQDAINKINNEFAKTREFIVGKVVYNKNLGLSESDVDAFLSGTTRKRAIGLDVPKEADLTKLFAPFAPQSASMLNTAIFDKERLFQAIDRVSSVSGMMRGEQLKTNTTNKIAESYQSRDQTRLDEKIDLVEDFIGDIGWKLAQLCVKNMDTQTVAQLIGQARAQFWDSKPDLRTFQTYLDLKVEGGSTTKPTSASKKQEAIQVGQVIGQFAKGSPAAVMVALKVMERAFDEVEITKQDWDGIIQSIQASMQQQQQQGQQQPQGQPGQPGQPQGQGPDQMAQVEQIIDSLPPQIKQQLGMAIAKGAPVRQAVGAAVQVAQHAQGQQQQQQQPQSGA